MLRPERMSQVSITGAKAVMPTVIETLHDLRLLHLEEYDGSWEGFDPGRSLTGADELSEQLVTVRSIESILDLDADDVDAIPAVDEGTAADRIEEIRGRVNELDDRRSSLRSELHEVEEGIDRVAPFAGLGIDLDLYRGYDSIEVAVGIADEAAVEQAVEDADAVRAATVFAADDVVAVFAAPAADAPAGVLDDAFVGLDFEEVAIPEAEGDPNAYLAELEQQRNVLETRLSGVESDMEELRVEVAPFLLGVERALTEEVEKREAPLIFATTARSFVAEGWVPTSKYEELAETLSGTAEDRIVVEELDRVDYDEAADHGHYDEEAADEHASDGAGPVIPSMHDENPPVVQNNPATAQPFELLVNLVSRPRYSELDPTLIVFLTFPLAFGFMIGDLGYGLLYMLLGGAMLRYGGDSVALRSLGWIGVWAGAFTALFGWLYGDLFGVHMHEMESLHSIYPYFVGAGTLNKGLQATEWVQLWLVVAILFGLLHLNIAFLIGFVNDRAHGLREAFMENVSWLLALDGFFLWVFSTSEVGAFDVAGLDLTAPSAKPAFLVGQESALAEFVGFAGMPAVIGVLGLAAVLVGIVLVGIGEGIEGLVESPAYILGHSLSYLRMTAVLLAKGGMAFVVNVLVFGGYLDDHGHTIFRLPGTDVAGMESTFAGLLWMDPLVVTIPAAIFLFVIGHVLVLLLGITAAGIQMTRLEWVEFFQKFYEGGGEPYEPYGATPDSAGETS